MGWLLINLENKRSPMIQHDCWLKGTLARFWVFVFEVKIRTLVKLGKIIFILLQKLYLFLEISNFRILHFQVSCHHQIPKHEKRNISLNNLGSQHSLLKKFGQLMSYCKRKNFIQKFYKKCCLRTGPLVFANN